MNKEVRKWIAATALWIVIYFTVATCSAGAMYHKPIWEIEGSEPWSQSYREYLIAWAWPFGSVWIIGTALELFYNLTRKL